MNVDLVYGKQVTKKKLLSMEENVPQEFPITVKKEMFPELRVIAYALGESEWIVKTRGFFVEGMSFLA